MKIALVRREWSVMGGAELYLHRLLNSLTRNPTQTTVGNVIGDCIVEQCHFLADQAYLLAQSMQRILLNRQIVDQYQSRNGFIKSRQQSN